MDDPGLVTVPAFEEEMLLVLARTHPLARKRRVRVPELRLEAFIVYDAGGALTDRAQLDEFGDNQAIPNNCLNCHGTTASYDAASHVVTGARFLPFDRDSFVFSTRGGFAAGDQQPAVTLLNQLVRDAGATPVTRELIAGWAAESAGPFVRPGWTRTALDQAVYQHVVASTCRGCHASNTDELAFATADDFRDNRAAITSSVCDERNCLPPGAMKESNNL